MFVIVFVQPSYGCSASLATTGGANLPQPQFMMQRREFLHLAAASAASHSLFSSAAWAAWKPGPNRDKFGGWTERKFDATGFFRVEKAERWWMVTPEGNAFLSFGVNHLYPDLWNQPYNRDAWADRLGVDSLDSDNYFPALREWFLDTCSDFGFNSVGVHMALSVVNQPRPAMPYMKHITFVDIPHWKGTVSDENFLDVYAPAFAEHCDRLAREQALRSKMTPICWVGP